MLFAFWHIIKRDYCVVYGEKNGIFINSTNFRKVGVSIRRIQVLCSEGRIPVATCIGYSWAIPCDAEKPVDARVKTGKYIKKREAE